MKIFNQRFLILSFASIFLISLFFFKSKSFKSLSIFSCKHFFLIFVSSFLFHKLDGTISDLPLSFSMSWPLTWLAKLGDINESFSKFEDSLSSWPTFNLLFLPSG